MEQGIKLVIFDVDDTLTDASSWQRLNLAMGVTPEEDQDLYDRYHRGEFSYEEWVGKLFDIYRKHGRANRESVRKVLASYEYKPGAKELVGYLKGKGYALALISGSVDLYVNEVARDLGIELAEANHNFIFDETGSLARIVTFGRDTLSKLNHLNDFCDRLGIPPETCACVGDGANDIELFRATGRGITFRGSPIESAAWKVVDSLSDIQAIL